MEKKMSEDFKRPSGISTGVLLNTNNEALHTYKRAKNRFRTVKSLEQQVHDLTKLVNIMASKLGINNDSTNSNS